MPTASKKALSKIFDTINFEGWEDELEWKNDHILICRLGCRSMAPYYPEGSIIIADTRERWPLDGDIYLLQFPYGTKGQKMAPQVAKLFYHYDRGKAGIRVVDNRSETAIDKEYPRIMPLEPEEIKTRKIKWILGRVWGVLNRFG